MVIQNLSDNCAIRDIREILRFWEDKDVALRLVLKPFGAEFKK